MRATVTFQEYSVKGWKSGKCAVCGKPAKRVKKFWQTQSPFNLDKDGSVKSADQIMFECMQRRGKWMKEPVRHVKCEEVGL